MLILCLFQNRSFSIREQSSTTSSTSVASLRMYTCSPSQNSPGNYPKKSLLRRKLQWGCVLFHIFFLYPPSFSQKKPWKMMLFENYDNIPCKGWQKNWSASGVGTTVFHLQNGSHVAVKIPSLPNVVFPRGGQRQGKCEFPTSLSEVQFQQFFFGGCAGFILIFGWELVQQQKTTWSWTWPSWNNWKRIHRINLVNEVVIWNYFIYWYLF